MSPNLSTRAGGRGQRSITKSKKAREIEGHVAGIDSAANFVPRIDSSLLSRESGTPTPKKESTTARILSATKSVHTMSGRKGAKSAPDSTMSGTHTLAVPGEESLMHAGGAAAVTEAGDEDPIVQDHHQITKQPQTQKKRSTRVRKPQKKASAAPRGRPRTVVALPKTDPADAGMFSPSKLQIYPWEIPRPQEFLNLANWQKEWKATQDERERAADTDPELDDWYEFPGNADDYSHCAISPGMSIEFSVARSFIKRAKRTFWAGQSWSKFESEERAIVPNEKAMAEKDPGRRERLLTEVLDNDLRLHIFNQLQIRLCREIWLEEHPDIDNMTVVNGNIVKKDSVIEGMKAAPPVAPPAAPRAEAPYMVESRGSHRQPEMQNLETDPSSFMADMLKDIESGEDDYRGGGHGPSLRSSPG